MKKTLFLLLVTLLPLSVMAQKYGFVDSNYILNNIPNYKAAQEQLNKLSEEWQKEVERVYAEIEGMYRDYQAERVLLTEDMRIKREEEIVNREREAKELQNSHFGQEGMLYEKRQELTEPIQEEVYKGISDLATEEGYAAIFDSAGGPFMLYFNPRYDLSDEVLQKLGYKN